MTKEGMINWINNASYGMLFIRWRLAPAGSQPFFQGEMGEYYSEVILQRRKEVGDAEHTRISKAIGWNL